MSGKTTIGWTDDTWNSVTGCTKASAGCKFCYVERIWPRLAGNDKTIYFGRTFTNIKCHPYELSYPAHKTRPRMIFVNSMSDTFHPEVPDEFIDQIFAVMLLAGQHTFQVLTKRIERAAEYLSAPDRKSKVAAAARALLASGNEDYSGYAIPSDIPWPLPNVWIGTSVEDQKAANERIRILQSITAAAVRYLSVEPMIGSVDLLNVEYPDGSKHNVLAGEQKIDWVIVGCESGSQRRKLDIDWVRAIRAACRKYGTRFFLKQLFLNGKLVDAPELDGYKSVEFPGVQLDEELAA